MVNRTARPIAISQISQLSAFGLHTRARIPAFLGDENGNIEAVKNSDTADNEHYGRVFIRFASGVDSDGFTKFSQAVTARAETSFPHKSNLPVLVQRDGTTDEWVLVQIDYKRTNDAGLNTNAYNPLSPALQRVHLRQIVEGNVFAPSTASNPATNVVIEPLVVYFNGSLWDAGKTIADNVDLSSYIPAVGKEKLVAIAERLYDRSIQIIDGTIRNITSTKYSLSDVNDLATQFDEMVLPLRAIKLANNSGTVTQADMHVDLRQFMNVFEPRGFPLAINRAVYIMDNFQQGYHELAVDDGTLVMDGLLYEV